MPKLMAWQRDDFTGDVWDYTVTSGPDLGEVTRNYFYWKPVKFSAVSDGMGRMLVMFPETVNDLKPIMQIRNFRDAAGRELYKDGVWLMTEFEPVLDIFNKVHAYRTRLSLNVTSEDI